MRASRQASRCRRRQAASRLHPTHGAARHGQPAAPCNRRRHPASPADPEVRPAMGPGGGGETKGFGAARPRSVGPFQPAQSLGATDPCFKSRRRRRRAPRRGPVGHAGAESASSAERSRYGTAPRSAGCRIRTDRPRRSGWPRAETSLATGSHQIVARAGALHRPDSRAPARSDQRPTGRISRPGRLDKEPALARRAVGTDRTRAGSPIPVGEIEGAPPSGFARPEEDAGLAPGGAGSPAQLARGLGGAQGHLDGLESWPSALVGLGRMVPNRSRKIAGEEGAPCPVMHSCAPPLRSMDGPPYRGRGAAAHRRSALSVLHGD